MDIFAVQIVAWICVLLGYMRQKVIIIIIILMQQPHNLILLCHNIITDCIHDMWPNLRKGPTLHKMLSNCYHIKKPLASSFVYKQIRLSTKQIQHYRVHLTSCPKHWMVEVRYKTANFFIAPTSRTKLILVQSSCCLAFSSLILLFFYCTLVHYFARRLDHFYQICMTHF